MRPYSIAQGTLSEWKSLSHVQLFATPWTIQSMEFSRPEHWSGKPFPSPGDLPNPGIAPRSPALQADSLRTEPIGKPEVGPKEVPTLALATLRLVSKSGAVSIEPLSTEPFELTDFSTTMEFMGRSLLDLSSAPFLHFELFDLIVHASILFVEAFKLP